MKTKSSQLEPSAAGEEIPCLIEDKVGSECHSRTNEKQKSTTEKSMMKSRRRQPRRFAKRATPETKSNLHGYGGSNTALNADGLRIPSAVRRNAFITPVKTCPSRQTFGMFRTEREYKQAKRECRSIQRRLHRAKRRLLLELAEEQNKEAEERTGISAKGAIASLESRMAEEQNKEAEDSTSYSSKEIDSLVSRTSRVVISGDAESKGLGGGKSLALIDEKEATA